MKRYLSQVGLAIVCAILGFLLSYQYKELTIKNKIQTGDSNTEMLNEVESLKKEKAELTKSNESLSNQLANLEKDATQEGDIEKGIKEQLDTARMQLGLVSAKGPGVKIKMNVKSNMFSANSPDTSELLTDSDLVSVVNTLWFSSAEAISINGYRITPQTGIKVSGNFIWIGSAGRIDPSKEIMICAIGDIKMIKKGLDFQSFNYGNFSSYDINIEEDNNLVIQKTTQTLDSNYITAVNGD